MSFTFIGSTPAVCDASTINKRSCFRAICPIDLMSTTLPVRFEACVQTMAFVSGQIAASISRGEIIPLFIDEPFELLRCDERAAAESVPHARCEAGYQAKKDPHAGVPIRLSGETMPGLCAGKNGGNINEKNDFDRRHDVRALPDACAEGTHQRLCLWKLRAFEKARPKLLIVLGKSVRLR